MSGRSHWLWPILPILAFALLAPGAGVLAADVKDYAKAPAPANSTTFADAKGRFTMSVPMAWTAKIQEAGVQIFAPDNSSNLKVEALDAQGEALEGIVDATRPELKKNAKDNVLLSDAPAAFGPFAARHWIFHLEPRGIIVRVAQLLFKKGDRLFVISYASLPQKWETHSANCEQIIASLKPGE